MNLNHDAGLEDMWDLKDDVITFDMATDVEGRVTKSSTNPLTLHTSKYLAYKHLKHTRKQRSPSVLATEYWACVDAMKGLDEGRDGTGQSSPNHTGMFRPPAPVGGGRAAVCADAAPKMGNTAVSSRVTHTGEIVERGSSAERSRVYSLSEIKKRDSEPNTRHTACANLVPHIPGKWFAMLIGLHTSGEWVVDESVQLSSMSNGRGLT
ncbi:hypothetical protein DFH29DRAFT_1019258 [Suillus ampliporus]|nr:hypothetical protein DFH29DRAFT_1019258 [Suillus ampliporus]